eukprot:scaffold94_cov340-Prasinococcus_capsulatus_cf.AAC.11
MGRAARPEDRASLPRLAPPPAGGAPAPARRLESPCLGAAVAGQVPTWRLQRPRWWWGWWGSGLDLGGQAGS